MRIPVRFGTALRCFRRDAGGNMAMVFTLSMFVILTGVGAAVDYARMISTRTQLQNGTDFLALTVARELQDGKSEATIRAALPSMLSADLQAGGFTASSIDFTFDPTASTVSVIAGGYIPSTFMEVIGIKQLNMAATSVATVGAERLEIALVLDNTGSMLQNGKLDQLKLAANGMLDEIAASTGGQNKLVSVSIVPFGVNVNVGAANGGAPWLGAVKTSTVCTIFPLPQCTNVPDPWFGCVADRVNPNTTRNVLPTPADSTTLYPREYARACGLSALTPLTTDYAAAKLKVTAMTASGNTNLPIGIAWGWNMLTPSAPLSMAATSTPARKVFKYMILLTDGNNTENTLGSSVTGIDQLTADACGNVKAAGITVFTIRVVDGNETLLRSCATNVAGYYEASDPAMLSAIFKDVFRQITRLRLTS